MNSQYTINVSTNSIFPIEWFWVTINSHKQSLYEYKSCIKLVMFVYEGKSKCKETKLYLNGWSWSHFFPWLPRCWQIYFHIMLLWVVQIRENQTRQGLDCRKDETRPPSQFLRLHKGQLALIRAGVIVLDLSCSKVTFFAKSPQLCLSTSQKTNGYS